MAKWRNLTKCEEELKCLATKSSPNLLGIMLILNKYGIVREKEVRDVAIANEFYNCKKGRCYKKDLKVGQIATKFRLSPSSIERIVCCN